MASTGETSLTTLLRTLNVTLHPASYIFFSLPPDALKTLTTEPHYAALRMLFYEQAEQRWTAILDSKHVREHSLFDPANSDVEVSPVEWRMLTLEVHSSLEAVGFMATISKALADAGLSCNCVAGYFHDHIFVQAGRAEDAQRVIEQIAKDAREA